LVLTHNVTTIITTKALLKLFDLLLLPLLKILLLPIIVELTAIAKEGKLARADIITSEPHLHLNLPGHLPHPARILLHFLRLSRIQIAVRKNAIAITTNPIPSSLSSWQIARFYCSFPNQRCFGTPRR
jgi:hypothetical protein